MAINPNSFQPQHYNQHPQQEDKTNTMTNESNLSYSAFNIDGELQKHLNEIEDSLSDILPLSTNKASQSRLPSSYNPQRISNLIRLKTPSDNQAYEIELSLAVKGYPDILSFLNFNLKEMTLPHWINNKMLHDYYDYVKYANGIKCIIDDSNSQNSQQPINKEFNYKKLTRLANYFNNDVILKTIIECNIEPYIDQNNCINLINDAFNYCSMNHYDKQSDNDAVNASLSLSIKLSEKIRALWFKLFLSLRSFIVTNLLAMSSNPKLLKINHKLLDDIIEAFLVEIYQKHIEISSDLALKLIKIIIQSKKINKTPYNNSTSIDIIDDDILTYLKLSSDVDNDDYDKHKNTQVNSINKDIIKDLKENQSSIFSIDLFKDITHHYQEKLIKFDQQELLFSTHYDKNDDLFSLQLKLNSSNQLEVFSFISFTHLLEDKDYDRLYSKTLNGSMSVCIFKIINYKGYLDYMRSFKQLDTIRLEVKLKFNIVQTFTLFYLKTNFERICRKETIAKLPMNTFETLLTDVTCEKEEEPLLAIMNWLSDEMNRPEEVMGLMEDINWKMIPLGRIFEFVVKCPRILGANSRVEYEIIAAIFDKANRKMEEMKKERMYQEVRFKNQMKMMGSSYNGSYGSERHVTEMSYEGDMEKYKAVLNYSTEDKDKNKDKDKETSSKKNDNSPKTNINTNEAQIGLISYFFVNLIECSKKLNYPRLYFENKNLHHVLEENAKNCTDKPEMTKENYTKRNDSKTSSKEKLISVYKKDKLNIFNFSRLSDSNNANNDSVCTGNDDKKKTKSPQMKSRSKVIGSCEYDQPIKIPSIVMMTEQNKNDSQILSQSNRKGHSSNSLCSLSNMSEMSSSKHSLIKQGQPSIKLCSIVRGGNKSVRSNTNKDKEKVIRSEQSEGREQLMKYTNHDRNKSETSDQVKDSNSTKPCKLIQVRSTSRPQSVKKSQDIT